MTITTDAPSGVRLRDYQEEDVAFFAERGGRGCLWSEPGTGKTAVAIEVARRRGAGRILVVAPKVTHGVWEAEFAKWDPNRSAFLAHGTEKHRGRALQNTVGCPWSALVTSFWLLHEVVDTRWDCVIFDEAHQAVASRSAKAFADARRLAKATPSVLMLTGTPTKRGPQDLWAYLHLLDAERFGSYWSFVNRWCLVNKTPFGHEIVGAKDPRALSAFLREFARRRLKREVMPELPEKTRRAVQVDLEGAQRKLYRDLAEQMIAGWMQEGPDGDETRHLIVGNRLAQATRLRQLLVHPALVGADGIDSVGMEAACELAEQYAWGSDGRAAVIFTPFSQAIPKIEEKLRARGLLTYRLSGDTSQRERVAAVETFRIGRAPAVLIATSSLGLGWSATRASNAIFLGFEWDPNLLLQCEDRLHRFGQQRAVNLEYVTHRNTIDRRVLDVLSSKENFGRSILNDPRGLLLNHSL